MKIRVMAFPERSSAPIDPLRLVSPSISLLCLLQRDNNKDLVVDTAPVLHSIPTHPILCLDIELRK